MKAVRIHAYGGPDVLHYEDTDCPTPGAGELLVQVRAASINPVDWKVRSGHVKAMFGEQPFPMILGGDFAGVVSETGSGVSAYQPGDAVFGMKGLIGAHAEYIVVKQALLAHKPLTLDFVQAASVPLAGLTAWQALFDAAQLQAGQRVLIHAGAGGVGSFAVQLAHWKGARVTATASPANFDYVKGLGADQLIDYRSTPVECMGSGYDAVIDAAGFAAAERFIGLLKPGGIVVVVAGRPAPREPDAENRRLRGIIVQPSGHDLRLIAEVIDAGVLRTEIAAVFPLSQAAAAHTLSEQGHTRGKIVLKAGH